MAAVVAAVRATRSAGASSTSRPRRPAETSTVSWSSAEASTTVGCGRFWPSGEMPPDDVAGRPLGHRRVGHHRLAGADRAGQRLQVEPPGDRDDGDDEAAVRVCQQGLEDPGRVDAEQCRGLEAVGLGARVVVVRMEVEGDVCLPERLDGRCPRSGPRLARHGRTLLLVHRQVAVGERRTVVGDGQVPGDRGSGRHGDARRRSVVVRRAPQGGRAVDHPRRHPGLREP